MSQVQNVLLKENTGHYQNTDSLGPIENGVSCVVIVLENDSNELGENSIPVE